MTYEFDKKTKDILIKHGWHQDRMIDATKYRIAWKKDGYTVTQEALRFSQNLGGLSIKHEAYRASNQYDESNFDPIDAMKKLDPRWVFEVYENFSQSKLCPIGLGFSKHMTYFVSEQGKVYGGYDDYFCLIGQTVEMALKNILFIHQFETLNE